MTARLAWLSAFAALALSPFVYLAICEAAPPPTDDAYDEGPVSHPRKPPYSPSSRAPTPSPPAYASGGWPAFPASFPSGLASAAPDPYPPCIGSAFAPAYAPLRTGWHPAAAASSAWRPRPAASASNAPRAPPSARPAEPPRFESVRVLHAAAGLPPIDLCFAEDRGRGTDYSRVRPAIGGRGLAYGQMSTYLEVPEGASELRVVAAFSRDCSKSIVNVDSSDTPDTERMMRGGPSHTEVLVRPLGADDAYGIVTEGYPDYTSSGERQRVHDPRVLLRVASLVQTGAIVAGTGSLTGDDFSPIRRSDEMYCPWTGPFFHMTLSAHRERELRDGVVARDVTIAPGYVASFHVLEGRPEDGLRGLVCTDDFATSSAHVNPTCRMVGPVPSGP